MDTLDESKAIWEMAIKAYWDEYKEYSDAWKSLETKAQAMITSNGIFLAAAFAFARETQLTPVVIVLTVLTLLALFFSMVFSLQVLKVAHYETPVDSCHLTDIALTGMMHHTKLAKPTGDRLLEMHRIALHDRNKVIKAVWDSVQEKVRYLSKAHRCLLAASFFAVVATVTHISHAHTSSVEPRPVPQLTNALQHAESVQEIPVATSVPAKTRKKPRSDEDAGQMSLFG